MEIPRFWIVVQILIIAGVIGFLVGLAMELGGRDRDVAVRDRDRYRY